MSSVINGGECRDPDRAEGGVPQGLCPRAVPPRPVLVPRRDRRVDLDRAHQHPVHPARAEPGEHADVQLRRRRRRHRAGVQLRDVVHYGKEGEFLGSCACVNYGVRG
jgi:hypothetical protein